MIQSLATDVGPFRSVGSSFTVAGGRWIGLAFASPVAIYLLKNRPEASQANPTSPEGLLALAVSGVARAYDDVRTCSVAELPAAVRAHVDPRDRYGRRSVIVLPRQAARRVRGWPLGVTLDVDLPGESVTLHTWFFRTGGVRRFLRSHGWPVDRAVEPTCGPIHGEGMGRLVPRPAKPPSRQLGVRVFYGLLLLTIVAITVASRVRQANRLPPRPPAHRPATAPT
ncbi:MAG TPA: hypothetical protein VF796_11865 [Humisphaera sp.]